MLPNVESINPAAGAGAPARRPELEKASENYKANVIDAGVQGGGRAAGQAGERKSTRIRQNGQDTAEINFSLTQEERAAFVSAFSSKQDSSAMTDEEKSALKQASERISKYVDEAIAKNTDKRDRIEKAVKEWYSGIVKGEDQGPTELLQILRRAAMGQLDGLLQK